jgi:hypothetical protein
VGRKIIGASISREQAMYCSFEARKRAVYCCGDGAVVEEILAPAIFRGGIIKISQGCCLIGLLSLSLSHEEKMRALFLQRLF